MSKEKTIIISEKSLGDLIVESFRQLKKEPGNPVDEGNEILFGKDGKPLSHHRCNICNYLFDDSELLEDDELGLICEGCNDNKDELEQEQEDLATLIRDEKHSKCF